MGIKDKICTQRYRVSQAVGKRKKMFGVSMGAKIHENNRIEHLLCPQTQYKAPLKA